MNVPHRPLSPETLDELLSADIDGELDRAATELGLTAGDARAAIGTDDAAARREALMTARDHLAVPPALDPERASQLVASAIATSAQGVPTPAPTPLPRRGRPSRSAWRVLAGAGAAAAVVVAIIVITASSPGPKSQATSAKAPSENAAASAEVPKPSRNAALKPSTFGDVSTPGALRDAVADGLGALSNSSVATAHEPRAATSLSQATDHGGAYSSAKSASGSGSGTNVAQQTCVDSIASTAHFAVAPVLAGTGTVRAQPVFVIVYPQGSSHLVYVVSARDCSVISRSTVP